MLLLRSNQYIVAFDLYLKDRFGSCSRAMLYLTASHIKSGPVPRALDLMTFQKALM